MNPWKNGIDAANKAPRCGALTRNKTQCKSPALKGRKRCGLHGGSSLSGVAHSGYKHGLYTKEHVERIRQIRKLISDSYKFTENLNKQ